MQRYVESVKGERLRCPKICMGRNPIRKLRVLGLLCCGLCSPLFYNRGPPVYSSIFAPGGAGEGSKGAGVENRVMTDLGKG